MKADPEVLLLASGGIDSTALLDFYLRRKSSIACIHFQYGQPSAKSEEEAFRKITEYYGVRGEIIPLEFNMARRKDEVSSRNALFVLVASSLGVSPVRIALGIHSDSPYYDCTRSFINDCQQILDGYYSGAVRLEAPFIDFTKRDILNYCKLNGVPVNLTYSCLRKNYPPCGICPACLDRVKYDEK
jgi:7-cyano-7-deazaguanine synthase